MGIAPYKYFTYDGESSRDYDVYLTGDGVFNAPQRAVDLLEIPGRNGNYALDQGRFNNITVTYKAGIVDYSESDFADKVSAVRNWLCSKVGYVRLTDDYNPDEYRMAVFKNGITVDHDDLKTGEFEITFECKPQRWLTSGETPIEIGEYQEIVGTDNEPYFFRAVPQFSGDFDTEKDTLVGGSVAWNQLAGNTMRPAQTKNSVQYTPNNDGTFTLNGTADADDYWVSTPYPATGVSIPGHKYYIADANKNGSATTFGLGFGAGTILAYGNTGAIVNAATANQGVTYAYKSGAVISNKTIKPMMIDLTQMFGATIADYIYSLETNNSGDGVAFFRKYFPEDYYAYDSGSIQSVEATAHKTYDSNNTLIGNYALDSDLVLRGVPKLADGKLYYDGDIYESDGTVTRKYGVVDLGTLNWSKNGTYGYMYSLDLGSLMASGTTRTLSYICEKYTCFNTGGAIEEVPNLSVYNATILGTTALCIKDTAYTDSAAFKIAMNGVYVIYPLATPTTESADPFTNLQVVDPDGTEEYVSTSIVPVGHNTKYGQDPMVLINPTPFEAEPLLAVKGYGTIDFNGYEVEIENGDLGTIQLASSNTMSTDTATISLSNVSSLNLGDTIYFSHDLIDSSVGIRAGNVGASIDPDTITLTSSSNVVATPKLIRNSKFDFSVKLVADMSARFVYGTSSTITSTATFSAECMDYTNITISASLTVVYDGDDTITVTRAVSVVGKTMIYLYPSMTIDEIYGDSTVNFLGDPTYIDCDLGECYKYESGEIVSLNGVIALGSDLPKLSSGANTFTMDGTVTELKVTPRYWKV